VRALVVHGGAGNAASDAVAGAQTEGCERALAAAWDILAHGGSALDAVVDAVTRLEDEPVFNAGRGACLTEDGTVELDASVMDGHGRRAGAVALVRRLRNPVRAAHALLEDGRHVFMAGDGAEVFAAARGLTLVDPETLITSARLRTWTAHQRSPAPTGDRGGDDIAGTVGAVALDVRGHVAAATSTGGTSMKRAGRIGDSPIVGAGTLADDHAGAISATGDGEAIMRATLASETLMLLERGIAPDRAATLALATITKLGGSGGLIVVDRFGRTAAAHTTPAMTWCSRRD
jgi:beta-aspartyl-peptidase (threonine type)